MKSSGSILKEVIIIILVIAIAGWVIANPAAAGNLLQSIADLFMYIIGQIITLFTAAVT